MIAVGERAGRFDGLTALAIGVVLAATVALLAVTGGNPGAAAAPVLLIAGAYALATFPVRWATTGMVFLMLALDVAGDGYGIWNTPFILLGDVLTDVSGAITHVKVAGFEVLTFLLLAVVVFRRSVGSARDGLNPVPVATAARDALLLYLLGFLYAEAISVASGHGLAPWKARYLLHVPLLFLLFQAAYRDPRDFRALAMAVVAAAQIKGLIAFYVQIVAVRLTGGKLAYATNHGDSVLFVMALVILAVRVMEQTSRRAMLEAAALAVLPMVGLMENGRRIAWAMLELALMLIYFVSPWKAWKRTVTRAILIGAPVLLLYVAAGWNSGGGGLFGPVHKIRTMLDGSVDSSTFWREVEAWNVANTMRDRPYIGTGLGGEYVETMMNDDISAGYKEYREWPHNTVLGLLLYAGLPGFTLTWFVYPVTLFLAVRILPARPDRGGARRSAGLLRRGRGHRLHGLGRHRPPLHAGQDLAGGLAGAGEQARGEHRGLAQPPAGADGPAARAGAAGRLSAREGRAADGAGPGAGPRLRRRAQACAARSGADSKCRLSPRNRFSTSS
ncbi:MAG: O-antigen ligase family protein [Anaeromyxobacter sp.]